MKEHHGVEDIPLYPFFGNRFNILFLNGAGVFHLYQYHLDFFEKVESENKLLTAVSWDLKVLSYKAGCKALGLLAKLVTGPLWRAMIKEKGAITPCYQHMLGCFEKWANDCSSFIKGDDSLFPDLNKDDSVYKSVIEPAPLLDDMTRQCLELIFGGFVVISKRMLEDHLVGGKFDQPNELLKTQTASEQTTNADAEQDFGMLDRLMKLKPKALDIVYEGIIMFNRNETRKWRDSLTPEQLSCVMKKARESKILQKQLYFERKKKIWQRKAENFKAGVEERERKDRALVAEKESLVRQIRGVWWIMGK